MIDTEKIFKQLKAVFFDQIELTENAIYVKRESIPAVLKALKESFGYTRLADVTSADYEDRYEIVYHLSNDEALLLAIKVKLDKTDCKLPTVTFLWRYANQMEREIYDLMGIIFEGHSNLKRILNPDDFEGHPLRKSFKLDIAERF
jgi:NADH-quinone oxidoreductase subunit C